MANYFRVNMRETIMMFLAKGWSARHVAREFGVNRRTVAKYAMQEQAKRATVTAGLLANWPPLVSAVDIPACGGYTSVLACRLVLAMRHPLRSRWEPLNQTLRS